MTSVLARPSYKEWYGLIESEGEILSLRSSHRCIAAMTLERIGRRTGRFQLVA